MGRASDWLERHQVALCLVVAALAVVTGVAAPAAAAALEYAVAPVLVALLYATFLGVPFARVLRAFADARFLLVVLGGNFLVVPVVVFALTRFVASEPALLVGVLLVLLSPCVDYVIVFAGLAGGARERLLAATPLLMLGQIALLPVYLLVLAGPAVAATLSPAPFASALLLFVLLPAAAAALTQFLARGWWPARMLQTAASAAMVPLLLVTLLAVIASQTAGGTASLTLLVSVVPLFAAFVVLAAGLGLAGAAMARLDASRAIAATFGLVTRNSLVVLPLALALPAGYSAAPLVVVIQTVVELVAMVGLVALFRSAAGRWLLRRLPPPAPRPTAAGATP